MGLRDEREGWISMACLVAWIKTLPTSDNKINRQIRTATETRQLESPSTHIIIDELVSRRISSWVGGQQRIPAAICFVLFLVFLCAEIQPLGSL
jgi:hypothetical protein